MASARRPIGIGPRAAGQWCPGNRERDVLSLLRAFWTSTAWSVRVLRVAALSVGGWYLVQGTPVGRFMGEHTAVALNAAGLGAVAGAGARQMDDVRKAWPRTDFSRRAIDLAEVRSGGPPKDGIPAIDHPRFERVSEAADWVASYEPVIVVAGECGARAYPVQILIWHEIVNDELCGVPIAVTFCPLCNASLVFERRVQGETLDFGTTGRLRLSDMVMYDRQSESWWQQFTGEGLVGKYTGVNLTQVAASIVAFSDFSQTHPGGEVLSKRTGYRREYGNNPYVGYDRADGTPFAFDGDLDPRLAPMERVIAVSVERQGQRHQKIYPFTVVREAGVINDEVDSVAVVVFARPDGTFSPLDERQIDQSRRVAAATAYVAQLDGARLTFDLDGDGFRDRQSGSHWNLMGRATSGPHSGRSLSPLAGGVHFAFAWLAFNPDAPIYRPAEP